MYVPDMEGVIETMSKQLSHSRADSTVRKYSSYFKGFEMFCDKYNFTSLPASAVHVAMYLSHLISVKKSDKVLSAVFYSIKWHHFINDMTDPTENSIVKNLLESGKRMNSTPCVKKDVVTSEDLISLCTLFSHNDDVLHLRDLSMIMLSYAGFFTLQ